MTARRRDLDSRADELAADYRQGLSTWQLSEKYGCSQATVMRVMLDANIPRRDISKAGRLRASRESMETKARRSEATSRARTGSKMSVDSARKGAATREAFRVEIGAHEELLAQALERVGIKVRSQVAVDRYNLDLAYAPFAIEVHNNDHRPEIRPRIMARDKFLRESGWHTIYVWHRKLFPVKSHSHKARKWHGEFRHEAVAEKVAQIIKTTDCGAAPRSRFVLRTCDF